MYRLGNVFLPISPIFQKISYIYPRENKIVMKGKTSRRSKNPMEIIEQFLQEVNILPKTNN